jgi:hypothetical protein
VARPTGRSKSVAHGSAARAEDGSAPRKMPENGPKKASAR